MVDNPAGAACGAKQIRRKYHDLLSYLRVYLCLQLSIHSYHVVSYIKHTRLESENIVQTVKLLRVF